MHYRQKKRQSGCGQRWPSSWRLGEAQLNGQLATSGWNLTPSLYRVRPVLKHPGALRRMVTPPIELSMGEAFIYGDFDIEGDIFAAFSLIDTSLTRKLSVGEMLGLIRSIRALPKSGPARPLSRGPSRLRGRLHSRERDLAAIRYHYDVGNDFFALWLDPRMQYSCGYFPTGSEGLDTAQERKLEHICRKLRLQPGERLLDVGCGWGGLATYAAERYGVEALVSRSARTRSSTPRHSSGMESASSSWTIAI